MYTRAGLETAIALAAKGTNPNSFLLDGGDGGRHRIWHRVIAEPTDQNYDCAVLSDSKWTWAPQIRGPNCQYVALANYKNQLVAIIQRKDTRLLYSTYSASGWTYPRTIPGGYIRSYERPYLAVVGDQLWCAFTDPGLLTRLAYTSGALGDWTVVGGGEDIQGEGSQPYRSEYGPGLAWFNNKFYYAWRSVQKWMLCYTYRKGARTMSRGPSFPDDHRTNRSISLVVFRNALYSFYVGTNNRLYHAKLNAAGDRFESLPNIPGEATDSITCAVHSDRLWITHRGTSGGLTWGASWDGSKWATQARFGELRGETTGGLASYDGKLWATSQWS